MLILIFSIILLIGLIIAASCYGHLVKTYNKYSSQEAFINFTALQIISKAITNYKFNTKIVLTNDNALDNCYVPKKDIIFLSSKVAYSKSIADISIACHELGHTMQNYHKSRLLKLNRFLAFISRFASFLLPILLLTCLVLIFIQEVAFLAPIFFYVSIGLWLLTWIFRLITIPLELDASKRAYNVLKENDILTKKELKITKKFLHAAAFTYVGGLFINLYKFYLILKRAFRRN